MTGIGTGTPGLESPVTHVQEFDRTHVPKGAPGQTAPTFRSDGLPADWPEELAPVPYPGDDPDLQGKQIINFRGVSHTFNVNPSNGDVRLTPIGVPGSDESIQTFIFSRFQTAEVDEATGRNILKWGATLNSPIVMTPSANLTAISQWAVPEAVASFYEVMMDVFESNKDMARDMSDLFIRTLTAQFEEAKAAGDMERKQAALAVAAAWVSLGMSVASVVAWGATTARSRQQGGKAAEGEQNLKEINREGATGADRANRLRELTQRDRSAQGRSLRHPFGKKAGETYTPSSYAKHVGELKGSTDAWARAGSVFPQFLNSAGQSLGTIFFEADKADAAAAKRHAEVAAQSLGQLAQRLQEELKDIFSTNSTVLRFVEEMQRAHTEAGRV